MALLNIYEKDPTTLVLSENVPSSSEAAAAPTATLATSFDKGALTAEEALAIIFPPTSAEPIDGVAMTRVAMTSHTDKMDVIHLQEALEARCKSLGAREHGVCPLREGAYRDALNEIIRQITVECPERGLLLAILRDEVEETNGTYDVLFNAACQFGIRREIERDLKRTMESKLHELTVETGMLDNRVNETKAKYDGLVRMFQDRVAADEKKHAEEVSFMKRGNLQLTTEIKRLTS